MNFDWIVILKTAKVTDIQAFERLDSLPIELQEFTQFFLNNFPPPLFFLINLYIYYFL